MTVSGVRTQGGKHKLPSGDSAALASKGHPLWCPLSLSCTADKRAQPSPRVPRELVPPLGPNLHGRKGPGGEEAGRGQAAAQAVTRFPPRSVCPSHQLGVRSGLVTMAGLVLSPVPSNCLVLLLLLSGTPPTPPQTRPMGFTLCHWLLGCFYPSVSCSPQPPHSVSHAFCLLPLSDCRGAWVCGDTMLMGSGVCGPSPSPAWRVSG